MKIQPISESQNAFWQVRSFKCHKGTTEKIRDYGKVIQDTGIFKGYKLDVYSAYSREEKLVHKLYYLSDIVGNWIKSKLKYYGKNGKCYKTIWSKKDDKYIQK